MFLFGNKSVKMEQAVDDCLHTPGALLIDVRSRSEYRQGHLPNSINIPMEVLGDIAKQVPSQDTPLYLYCHSGMRSGQCVRALKAMG